ncbi:MAG: N-acetylmuramoyl-L-alanine amidase [Bacteroidales bacterium]|nr:N-acetylmuramoyl-L-alanine amidase [Bacteroidales bacterium]
MKNRFCAALTGLCVLLLCGGLQAGPIKTIVIDAGHGGHDPGAVGATGSHESMVVLDVALRLGKIIQQQYPDVKVVYTRKTDVFVELYKRAEIANRNKADLFISLHCNSSPNATAYGTETFVMGVDKTNANMAVAQKENAAILKETDYENNYEGFDPYSPESYIIFSLLQNVHLSKSAHFASLVQKNFKNDLCRSDRGVKQAPFLVLWRTTMPSVLIELGFLSNRTEEAYLLSEKGKNELSQSIAKAIGQLIVESGGAEPAAEGTPRVTENAPEEPTPSTAPATAKEAETPATSGNNASEAVAQPADLVYKVQFASSSQKKESDDWAFRGLPAVQCQPSGKLYVYTAGEETTYAAIQEVLQTVKAKGYTDAFVIALYKGRRITLDEAKKLEKQP